VLNDVVLGDLSLQFSSSSVVYISSAELLHALDGRDPRQIYGILENMSSQRETVTFDDLRASGLDMRYDAVNDRVVVKI